MKKLLSLCMALVLCLSLLPVTALAVGEPATLYVGNKQVISSTETTYWTTDASGTLTQSNENGTWNVKYDPGTATLTLNEAKISGSYDKNNNPFTAGIYAKGSSNQAVALTIELIGTNTITGNYGIYVDAQQGETVGTNASLLIQNSSDYGILEVSGSSHGIYVKSGTGNASLTIKDASVVASSSSSYEGYAGVCVQSGSDATSSPQISLAVNGGSLTTGASEGNDGIQFYVGSSSDTTNATTSLTISDNAIVRAENGIKASRVDKPTPSGTGIVFDGTEGTVYGDVELQEDLEIGEGETLTIGKDASLTVPEDVTLTNNGKIDNSGKLTVDGGTLTGDVIYKVTGVSLSSDTLTLKVGESHTLTATITPHNATDQNVTWSSDNTSVATVDANGEVTTVGAGTATITATAADGSGEKATCAVTVTAPPEPEPEPEPTPPPYIPPTYAVTVPETTGGTVTVSPSRASRGRTVTITATPDLGYELESLTVLDSRGQPLELTNKGNGRYTFTMPSSRVTVEATFTPAPLPFEDVAPGAWYESAVRYAYFHNIMEGMSETEFAPATALTRAMAVQILYNLEGQPTVSGDNEFIDVSGWYETAVTWAAETGVATGYGDGTFQPTDSITRQEFAQMLYNYAKYKSYDLTAEGDLSTFPDSGSVADWAKVAMSWANGNKLINGHDDGTIDAAGAGTRAQAASILMKLDQNITA